MENPYLWRSQFFMWKFYEGKAIFSVYSHAGYAKAVDSDYDGARAAMAVVAG